MAALLGVQSPRVATFPKTKWSDAEDCAFLATAYGLTPDQWQLNVLEAWMRRDRAGKWAAGRWGITVPRQNGKNGILEMVELFFMAQLGLKILHTAHEVKTARKAFLRIASFFENERKYPELAALVKDIRKTNGQEAIVLHNGGSVEFIARSKGSGRGFTVDVLVCDEAQEYGEDAQAALLPTISSAPSGDPLQILLGTPPAPNMDGDVFTRMRTAGVAGKDKRLAWVEWSVAGDIDVADRSLWAATNPSLGIRLNQTTIEDEFGAMSEETFARERLGMWASDERAAAIPSNDWNDRAISEVPEDWPLAALGLDMNPERTKVSVAVAAFAPEHIHIELALDDAFHDAGSRALVDWIVTRAKRRIPVVLDAYSPARSLEPELKKRGCLVRVMGAAELSQACGGLYDAITQDATVTHHDQKELNQSLAGATKENFGPAGAWKWNRKSFDVDLSPLMAATAAHFGAVKFGRRRRVRDESKKAVIL